MPQAQSLKEKLKTVKFVNKKLGKMITEIVTSTESDFVAKKQGVSLAQFLTSLYIVYPKETGLKDLITPPRQVRRKGSVVKKTIIKNVYRTNTVNEVKLSNGDADCLNCDKEDKTTSAGNASSDNAGIEVMKVGKKELHQMNLKEFREEHSGKLVEVKRMAKAMKIDLKRKTSFDAITKTVHEVILKKRAELELKFNEKGEKVADGEIIESTNDMIEIAEDDMIGETPQTLADKYELEVLRQTAVAKRIEFDEVAIKDFAEVDLKKFFAKLLINNI